MPSNLPFYRLNKSIIEVYKLETGNYQKPPAKAHVFYCGNLQPFGKLHVTAGCITTTLP